jgi:hypothetical protein
MLYVLSRDNCSRVAMIVVGIKQKVHSTDGNGNLPGDKCG